MKAEITTLHAVTDGETVTFTCAEAGKQTGSVVDVEHVEHTDGGAWVEVEIQTDEQRVSIRAERDGHVQDWSGLTADFGSHEEIVECFERTATREGEHQ